MKTLLKLDINGHTIKFRHLKRSDVDGVWQNFNEVVDEGIFLPVFDPVKSSLEKSSWYDAVKREKEVVIIAEDKNARTSNEVVGQCEISNIEWDAADHVGNLGIIVQKKYRDMGIGRQLIDLAIIESKRLNDKQKIILSCFSSNERALHLYKNLGFKKIGERKKQYYIDGVYYDETLMELFIEEYLENQT